MINLNLLRSSTCFMNNMFKRSFSMLTPNRPGENPSTPWHSTTILAVKKNNEIVLMGDGQVTYGSMRLKMNGKKIKKLHGTAVCGFAGIVYE